MKDFIARIILVTASIAIVLFLLEITFRVFRLCPADTSRGCLFSQNTNFMLSDNLNLIYELKPLSSSGINSDGMHDREYSIVKPPHTIRIAILGDSISFGSFVEEDKSFPNVLEDKLRKYCIANNSSFIYEVLNFSVPGYNTNNEIEQLKVKVAKYNPDIIILSYFVNDTDPLPHMLPLALNAKRIDTAPNGLFYYLWNIKLVRLLVAKSDLFRFVILRIYSIQCDKVNKQAQYQNVIHGFKKIKEYADNNSVNVIILFNPFLNYEKDKTSEEAMLIIKKLAHANSFIFMNMLDYYYRNFKSQEEIWIKGRKIPLTGRQDVVHPNLEGHELIATELFKTVLSVTKKRETGQPEKK